MIYATLSNSLWLKNNIFLNIDYKYCQLHELTQPVDKLAKPNVQTHYK